MKQTGPRATLGLGLGVNGGGDDPGLGAVVLFALGGEIGLEGFQVACASVVDEVVDCLEGELDWCGCRHFALCFPWFGVTATPEN